LPSTKPLRFVDGISFPSLLIPLSALYICRVGKLTFFLEMQVLPTAYQTGAASCVSACCTYISVSCHELYNYKSETIS